MASSAAIEHRSRPSPLPNRSAPDGTLVATPARGDFMGNRGGRLHRDDFSLRQARWRGPVWICCAIAFRGRQREIMGRGYTEIFFLDEATAMAAGHRPCFECRHAEARAFAMTIARGCDLPKTPRAREIDRLLHAERVGTGTAAMRTQLPVGAMYRIGAGFFLRAPGGDLSWSFEGYRPASRSAAEVLAVTPPTVRAALAAGYAPRLHASARQILRARYGAGSQLQANPSPSESRL